MARLVIWLIFLVLCFRYPWIGVAVLALLILKTFPIVTIVVVCAVVYNLVKEKGGTA